MWKRYTGRVTGIRLDGDPTVPPTRWWNHLYLLLFVWKEVTILEIPPEVRSYRVGFISEFGEVKYNSTPLTARRFAVRHGREPCRFFAVLSDGTELPLKVATRTNIDVLSNRVPLV